MPADLLLDGRPSTGQKSRWEGDRPASPMRRDGMRAWNVKAFGAKRAPLIAGSYFSGRSSGAPVPDEPTNNRRPSGMVTSRPLAFSEPSLA